MSNRKFTTFSLLLICYCILIIVWGAWVRISGSGDGCGVHWPLCQGALFPADSLYNQMTTVIEYLHRIKSGVFGILVALQCILAFRASQKGAALRVASCFALLFTVTEALLGALLVLGGFVGSDDSVGRLIVMSLHLTNTLLLVGSLTVVWGLSLDSTQKPRSSLTPILKELFPIFLLIVIIAASGAWAALSTTLFPSSDLSSGLQADFAYSSHYLIHLRIVHPLIAAIGAFLIWFRIQELPRWVHLTLLTQVLVGITTLLLHSPVSMKLLHLTISELLWVSIVYFKLISAADVGPLLGINDDTVSLFHKGRNSNS